MRRGLAEDPAPPAATQPPSHLLGRAGLQTKTETQEGETERPGDRQMMGKEGDSPQAGRGTYPTRSSQEKKQVWPPGTVLMNGAQEKGFWRC